MLKFGSPNIRIMTIGIITDSTSDLDWDYAREENIEVVPMKVMFHDSVHDEDESFNLDTYYENFEKEKLFKVSTSQPSPANFLTSIEKVAEKFDEIVIITVSSGLSGTLNSANIAKNQFLADHPNKNIGIIDTLSASAGEQLVVKEALRLIKDGITLDELTTTLQNLVDRISTHLLLPTLKYLRAGGRISLPKFLIGNLFGFKPILFLNNIGKLDPVSRITNLEKGMYKLVDLCTINGTQVPNYFAISHANDPIYAEKLKAIIAKKYPGKKVDVNVIGPVISAHTGIGGVAIFGVFDDPINKII